MLRRFFAGILLFAFLSVSTLFFVALGGYEVFGNRDFFEGEILDVSYNFAIMKLAEELTLSESLGLKMETSEAVLGRVFSVDDVRSTVDLLLDELLSARPDESGMAEITVPLNWISEGESDVAHLISADFFENKPTCGSGENRDFKNFECIPKGLAEEDLELAVASVLDREFFSQVPDEFVFSVNLPQGMDKTFGELMLSVMRWILITGGLICLLLLVGMGLFVFKPLGSVLKWEGFALFSASLSLLIFGLLQLPGKILEAILIENEISDERTIEFYRSLYDLIIGELARVEFKYGLIMVIIGIGMIIFGFRLNKKLANDAS